MPPWYQVPFHIELNIEKNVSSQSYIRTYVRRYLRKNMFNPKASKNGHKQYITGISTDTDTTVVPYRIVNLTNFRDSSNRTYGTGKVLYIFLEIVKIILFYRYLYLIYTYVYVWMYPTYESKFWINLRTYATVTYVYFTCNIYIFFQIWATFWLTPRKRYCWCTRIM